MNARCSATVRRGPWRDDAFDHGIVSDVRGTARSYTRRGPFLEGIAGRGRVLVCDAHPGEDDRERFTAGMRLRGDLCRELEMSNPPTRKIGDFWPTHQRRQHVDDRDSGVEDRLTGGLAGVGFSGAPFTSARSVRRRRCAPSSGVPRPLHAPSQASPTPMRIGWPEPRGAGRCAIPAVSFGTWITARSPITFQDDAVARPSSSRRISASSTHPTSSTPATTRWGPSTRRMIGVLDRSLTVHEVGSQGEDEVSDA